MSKSEEARVVINMDAAADLLLAKGQEGLVIRGIFLRRFNDFVRLEFLEDSQFLAKALQKMATPKKGKIWLSPDKAVETQVISLVIQGQTRSRRELSIPILSEDIPPTYFNFECTWPEEDSDVLLELENASPIIQFSHDWNNFESIQIVTGKPIIVELFPGRSIHLGAMGDSYPFLVTCPH